MIWSRYCAVILAAVLGAWVACAATLEGKVTRVSDGDTIWVDRVKVRLDRIDAPESKQAYGKESTEYLKRRIHGKVVKVEWQKRDQYGRTLGVVFLDGADINLEMVATGNAWHYSHFDKTAEYAEAEKVAREKRRGLWSAPSPENPYEFRKRTRVLR